MTWTTVLAGLSEAKDFWAPLEMLRYLLLLAGLDAVSGLYIANVVEQCKIFTLPRSGYARWYHQAMLGIGGVLCVLLVLLTGAAILISKDSISAVLIAAVVLALNILVISNIQMFITVLSGSMTTGYLVCMFIQLLSVFVSERLPLAGKLMLIGNWGMALRSTLANPNGVPIGVVIGIECFILIMLWIFGWRMIRRYKRGTK